MVPQLIKNFCKRISKEKNVLIYNNDSSTKKNILQRKNKSFVDSYFREGYCEECLQKNNIKTSKIQETRCRKVFSGAKVDVM